MTRKDYIAIAAAIHRTSIAITIGRKHTAEDAIRLATIDIAATMQSDNARFDRARFLAACGVQS